MIPEKIEITGIVHTKFDNPIKERKSTKVTSDFIMVIQLPDGHLFDINVSPSTFAAFEEGDGIHYEKIRKDIVYPNERHEYGYWFLNLLITFFILFIWGIVKIS